MFARGLAATNGKRAFLLAIVALVSVSITEARASNLLGTIHVNQGTIDSGGFYPGGTYTTGRFSWTRLNTSPGPGTFSQTVIPVGSHFSSFCIDYQGAVAGVYNLFDSIVGLPIPNPVITALNVGKVVKLVELNINHTDNPLTNMNAFLGTNLNQAQSNAAFQAALWALLGLNNGLTNVTGDTLTYATAMYNTANSNFATYDEDHGYFKILGMSLNGGQDQIVVMTRDDFSHIPPVPVPAGVVLAGMGIACIGGVNFLRRRKVVAVA